MSRVCLGVALGLCIAAFQAKAHFRPGTVHNQEHAITYAFCGSLKPCRYGNEAIAVSRGETRTWFAQGRCADARNGQYLGCFQMGKSERRRYGHSAGVWGQARSAFRYFKDSGRDWSPWECKPWGCGW